MKLKTLAILAGLTVVLVVGAIVVNLGGPAYTSGTGGNLVFPDFAAKINDAAKITITAADRKITVERKDNGWDIAEKYGYPAKFEVVKATLVGLAELKTLEAKTAEPGLYPRLEVEDVASGAKSVLVTVEDAKSAELAGLILGKPHYGRGAEGASEIYVRKAGDRQSWLATGTLQRNDDVKQWMQRDLVTLDRDRVREVDITPSDDKPYTLTKDKPGEGDFTLQGIPADDKIKTPYEANGIASAMAFLNADDVLPASQLKPDAKLSRKLAYKTFDGLTVDLALYAQDGKKWAKIGAPADAKGADAANPSEKPPFAPTEITSQEGAAQDCR